MRTYTKTGCDVFFFSGRDNSYRRGSDNSLFRQSRVKGARRCRVRSSHVIMAQLASYKAKVPPSTGNRLARRYVTQRKRKRDIAIAALGLALWSSSVIESTGMRREVEEERKARGEIVIVIIKGKRKRRNNSYQANRETKWLRPAWKLAGFENCTEREIRGEQLRILHFSDSE